MRIDKVKSTEVLSVRRTVLRPNQLEKNTIFPLDNHIESTHFAAFLNSETIGVVSVYKQPNDCFGLENQWRIRGMAVLENYRNKGIGAELLHSCIEYVKVNEAALIWANARTKALPFYLNNGFAKKGKPFEISGIGEHYLIELIL